MALPIIAIAGAMAQFAPDLLRFLGAGDKSVAAAEQVVGLAKAVTSSTSPEEALARLREDAAAQREFAMRAAEMDADLERDYLADRKDARARDIAYVQAGMRNRRADVMVAVDAVGLIACLLVLTFFRKDIPGEVVGLLSTIAGIFGLCLRDAHQYEFGSSRGSSEKTQLLAQQKP